MAEETKQETRKRDRISYALYLYYLLMLLVGIFLAGRFLYLKIFWRPDVEIERRLTQPIRRVNLEPTRGCILAADGRPIAMSYPRYQLYIDPWVRKGEFDLMKKDVRDSCLRQWKNDAALFAQGLSIVFPERSAEQFRKRLVAAFDQGSRYLKLGRPIEKEQLEFLQNYPLIKDGRYKGGVWWETVPTRRYPYGSLAKRTIGSVTENSDGSYYSGIDGKYNYVLHGEPGRYYMKKTDNGYVRDYDSTYVKAVDGLDIRTTLNIDYQDIADKLLRKYVEPEEDLEAACFVLMDVKTGAIKSMVNLARGNGGTGMFGENENVAVMRRGEPGSVFKITTLMTCIEDGIVTSIDQTIPAKDGLVQVDGYQKLYPADKHLKDYIAKYHSSNIPLWYCVKLSSNNAFRYLAINYYKDRPEDFIGRLHTYNLGKSFDFDVYEPITTPTLKFPSDKSWSKTDLGQIGMGYSVSVTPMHILAFYNAIANDGKMMKPYLVEDIEKNGKVIEKLGPSVLNSSICRPETAKMVRDALCHVTVDDKDYRYRGTAWRLQYISDKVKVAGKTGTADVFTNGKYVQADGARKQQGTFVGFFPAEDPQYSVICVVYSKISKKEFAGGVIPASVIRDFIKEIYNIDPYWNETVEADQRP
ncbi:MAG: penicillin-binding protein 2 [Bacteroidales bacterium]|nr:penicillin-binding protein 2 [Bacteroidales bacterium]